MGRWTAAAVASLAVTALICGCAGTASTPKTAATASVPPTHSPTPTPTPTPTGLSLAQATVTFLALTEPGAKADDAVEKAINRRPFSWRSVQAAERNLGAAHRRLVQQLRATKWPAVVQPAVNHLVEVMVHNQQTQDRMGKATNVASFVAALKRLESKRIYDAMNAVAKLLGLSPSK